MKVTNLLMRGYSAKNYTCINKFCFRRTRDKLSGRTDFNKYSSGCKTLQNFLVHPQGAATRRVGTQFIAEVKVVQQKQD